MVHRVAKSQTELKRLSTYSWILLLRLYFFWSSFRLVAIWRALWRFPIQPYAHISLDSPITNISYQCGTFVTAEKPKQTYNHPVSISILQLTLVAVILRIWTNTSNFMILYRIFSPLKSSVLCLFISPPTKPLKVSTLFSVSILLSFPRCLTLGSYSK